MAGFVWIRQVESRACLSFGRTAWKTSQNRLILDFKLKNKNYGQFKKR